MGQRLIAFSGLDGSGKSTYAQKVVEEFKSGKVVHIIEFRLINRILKSFRSQKESQKSYEMKTFVTGSKRTLKKRSFAIINEILLLIDAIRFNLFVRFSKEMIICDRYFVDLLVSHKYRYGQVHLAPVILRLTRTPDFSFYIDVDAKVAMNRELDDGHPLSYFVEKRKIYMEFIEVSNFLMIESSTIDQTWEQIVYTMKNR